MHIYVYINFSENVFIPKEICKKHTPIRVGQPNGAPQLNEVRCELYELQYDYCLIIYK